MLSTLNGWTKEVSAILQRLEANYPEIKDFCMKTHQCSIKELKDNFAWLTSRILLNASFGCNTNVLL